MNTARQEQLWPTGFQQSVLDTQATYQRQSESIPDQSFDDVDSLAACFGGLARLSNIPFLEAHDPRFDDFRQVGCDIHEIMAWANDGDAIFRRNRIQLLISFPLLVPRLAGLNSETHPLMLAAGVVVDRGDTLVDSLANIFGLSKSAVRHFCGRPVAQIGSHWTSEPAEALFAIDVAPLEARPDSRQDWEVFRSYWRCSIIGGWALGSEGPSRKRCFFFEYVFRSLCQLGYTEASTRRLNRMTGNLRDSVQQMFDYDLFVVEWCRATWPKAKGIAVGTKELNSVPWVFDSFLMRYPLAELIRQTVVWHKEISSVAPTPESDTPASEDAVNNWPRLLRSPVCARGISAVSLVSGAELEIEGFRLQHCVGSYVDRCLTGATHIISFQDQQGGSLSTAEIELELDGGRWTTPVIQHNGFENSTPPLECSLALDRVVQHLQEPAHQEWISDIQAVHEQRRDLIASQLWNTTNDRARIGTALMRKVLPDFDAAYRWFEAAATA